MDDHTVSWASVIYVALGSGATGYLLGAGSVALGGEYYVDFTPASNAE